MTCPASLIPDFELVFILSNFAAYNFLTVNANSRGFTIPEPKRVLILLLFFLAIYTGSFSQFQPAPVKRSDNQITIGGTNFYLHEVVKGQTLYGIAKAYQTSEEEIKRLNPELAKKSVFPGMVLRIPDQGAESISSTGKQAIRFILHTVLSKENLYSLSRKYGVKVEEIRELNPEAKRGLKTGQIIKIPTDKISIAQKIEIAEQKPAKNGAGAEDLAAMNEKAEKPCRLKPFPHDNDSFQLAVLLPLNIAQNDTLNFSDTLNADYFRFYEFLEGIYLAIDSMRLEGINLTVEVFDTEKKPETIMRILESKNFQETDLIIGPVFPNEIEVVAAFAKSRHIPMVSPFSTYDAIKNNPYVFQVRNKVPRQIELATNYLGSKYKQNVVVIGRMSEKANPEFIRFRENLNALIKENDPAKKAAYKTVYFNETTRNFANGDAQTISFESYLSASTSNFIILTSENEVFISGLFNQLHQTSTTHNIHVFGLNQWVFKDLDPGNLYNVNLELYSDLEDDDPFVDYTDGHVLNFCRKYKENWNIEPSKYSFHGFDIAWFFTNALFQFGRNLTSSVPCWTEYLIDPAMLTPMRFQSAGNSNGFENHAVTVFRYQKEQLLRKKVN